TSWTELGQALYSVWKDKLYAKWGYMTFDAYTAKEIGIRKQTALKLLKSYYFLEREKAPYLQQDYVESAKAAVVPGYESIDVLRKAKMDLDAGDYERLRKDVFEKGKDAQEVKKDLTALLKQRDELEPEEARRKKKITAVRRLLGTLKSLQKDVELLKLLPAKDIADVRRLVEKLENELGVSKGDDF
ncbi:MAG: hypothetical protein PVF65_12615, partial [Sphingomonadales bacterium]